VKAFTALELLDVSGRIAVDHLGLDGELQHHSKDLEQVVRRLRRICLAAYDLLNVGGPNVPDLTRSAPI
jgi:hypothetical protein